LHTVNKTGGDRNTILKPWLARGGSRTNEERSAYAGS
jgi:hypothetical protein